MIPAIGARFAVLALALGLPLGLGACGEEQVGTPPPPKEVGGEAIGYFCHMLLAEHGGPKGQIHLWSSDEPLWFSSVRDAVAFTRLKDEPKDIAAIYVNDMGKARDWTDPGRESWIEARDAWFVIASRRVGGMGLPEAVPFGTEVGAEGFAGEYGGQVVRLPEIPDDYVLGIPEERATDPAELSDASDSAVPDPHPAHSNH